MGQRIALLVTVLVSLLSAEHLDIFWIGNSLTQGSPGCYTQGWAWAGAMASHDSARTGVSVHCAGEMKGATDLCGHWAAGESDPSRTELADPTGGNIWAPGMDCMDARDHYDYVVLQGYRWGAPYDDEFQCAVNYAELALSYGTKPIFFCCWQDPSSYDEITMLYDSLYNMYKDQGALLAPVFQAHKLVLDDPSMDSPETLIYGTDTYHHDSNVGAYLKMCVFFEIFSGFSAEDFDIVSFRDNVCWDPDVLNTNGVLDWNDYMEEKAHEAVVNYYGTTGLRTARPDALRSPSTESARCRIEKTPRGISVHPAGADVRSVRVHSVDGRLVASLNASGTSPQTIALGCGAYVVKLDYRDGSDEAYFASVSK
jgi:hypothetical protein